MFTEKEILATQTNAAQYLFLALSARGPVSLLVNTEFLDRSLAKLPEFALEQPCVTVRFEDNADQIVGQKAISGWAIIADEDCRVTVPWDAVDYMLSPTDGVWVSWEKARSAGPNLGIIDGDGESATRGQSRKPTLRIA